MLIQENNLEGTESVTLPLIHCALVSSESPFLLLGKRKVNALVDHLDS